MTDQATHEQFLADLRNSSLGVFVVADYLLDRGFSCRLPARSYAPTHADWKEHADGGDLFIDQRIEVKHLSADFTGAHDWPFKDFMVCNQHSFDNAKPKPWAYFILNKNADTVAIVLVGKTKKSWTVCERTDGRNNHKQHFYLCPLDLVVFRNIKKPAPR